MKKLLILLVFFCTTVNYFAQTAFDSIRFRDLEQKFLLLEEKIFTSDSVYYSNNYNVAYEAYHIFDKLSYKAPSFYNNIKNDAFLNQLLIVNNPNSLELRKKIMDELQKSVISKVYDLLGKDSTRKRGVFKTIRNIFTSPIVQDVFKLIPFNNTISSILASVSSIVIPETRARNLGLTSILETTGDIKSVFENTPLQGLSKEIMPYIEFYDSLYFLNNKFLSAINLIKNKALELNIFTDKNAVIMKKMTNWNASVYGIEKIKAFDNLYIPLSELRNNPKFNTTQIVAMQQLYNVSNPIIDAYNKFLSLEKEYENTVALRKQANLRLLQNFKDKNKIFESVLTPILASMNQIDEPEIVSNPLVLSSAPMPNVPKYSEAIERRLREVEEANNKINKKYNQ